MKYLRLFQKNNGLLQDGVLGLKTLTKMKEVFNLSTVEDVAHFVAQLDHETAGFKYDKENLNYSTEGLLKTFSKYFSNRTIASQYARQPERIANRVYANRMGNGNEQSGDGWRYSGKWSIQVTGKNNYTAFSRYKRDSRILRNPMSVLEKYYWDAGLWFFHSNNLFNLTKTVDYNSIRKLTKRINGGYNGLSHRYDLTMKYYNILKKKNR